MFFSAVALGLFGSLHCLGMCGPIAFMLPLDRDSAQRKLGELFVYHSGRILAYTLLGLVFGLVGKGFYLFGLQQKLSIVIGVAMVLSVIVPNHYFRKYHLAKPIYGLMTRVKSKLGSKLKKRGLYTFLTIGFLNGLLPCGLVYMAILASIAFGRPLYGALYMALFGLGTVPLMTSAVYMGGVLRPSLKRTAQKMVPVFVVLVGVLFVLRGMGLGIPYVSPRLTAPRMTTTIVECH